MSGDVARGRRQCRYQMDACFARSVYDSMYLALALQTKTELTTADEKLVSALAGDLPVRWLAALQ